MVRFLVFASLFGCIDAARKMGSAPAGSSLAGVVTNLTETNAAQGQPPANTDSTSFAKSTSQLVEDASSGKKDPFFADLVVQYSLALWNLTNYSTLVKTRTAAPTNKKLVHKMGADVEHDRALLYSKVHGLYTVLETAPTGSGIMQELCAHGNFTNFERCLTLALCYIQKGVQTGQVDAKIFSVLSTLHARYFVGTHQTIALYMANVTNRTEYKQDHSTHYDCDAIIPEKPSKSVGLIEQHAYAAEQGESNVGVTWPHWDNHWDARRRSHWQGWDRRRRWHVPHSWGTRRRRITWGNAAEYGSKALRTAAVETKQFVQQLFDCFGDKSLKVEIGYKWDLYTFGAGEDPVGGGVSFEATLGLEVENTTLEVWKDIFQGKRGESRLKPIDFTIEAALSVVLGVGVDVEVADADLGLGAEVSLGWHHEAGGDVEYELELKLGVNAGAAVIFPGCPLGPIVGDAECSMGPEASMSIMCCSVELISGDHDCR